MSFLLLPDTTIYGGAPVGTPTVVASTENLIGSFNELVVDNPANVAGDQLLYFLGAEKDRPHDTPASITLLGVVDVTIGPNTSMQIFHKVSSGAEPAQVTFAGSGGQFGDRVSVALAIRDAGGTITLGTDNPVTGTLLTALSMNATLGSLIVELYAASWTMTKAGTLHHVLSGYIEVAVVVKENVPAGPTGDQTATATTSDAVGARQLEVLA